MKYYMREIYKRVRTISGLYTLVPYVEFFKTRKSDISGFNKNLKVPFKRTNWYGIVLALKTLKEDNVYLASERALRRELDEKIQSDRSNEERKRLYGDD